MGAVENVATVMETVCVRMAGAAGLAVQTASAVTIGAVEVAAPAVEAVYVRMDSV